MVQNMKIKLLASSLVNVFFWGTAAFGSQAASEGFSDIFTYDDPQHAKGLHVSLTGQAWKARDIQESDISFYQDLYADEKVMKMFGDGQPRDRQATKTRCESNIKDRFGQGHPHGFLTVINPNTHAPFMNIIAGGGDRKGTSEVGYAMILEYQGKKFGTNVVSTIVTEWAPEVRRIGLGHNLDSISQEAIIKAFRCFGGEVLDQLDATASPSNVASWKILDKVGFTHAICGVDKANKEPVVSYDGKEFVGERSIQYQLMEEEALKLFNPLHNATPLESAKRYTMVDLDGNKRTFSKHNQYNRIKYHFEKKVD